ncbi:MAG: hypothetical protein JKY70_17520 [Mucilaginibacter sp.]|nr:hypothetical protein [Mucilaginibacter sp.]
MTVVTIAGKYRTRDYVDGPGDQARFGTTAGIELTDDGTLYIVDPYNQKIRKITTDGIVSTVNIPKNSRGESLSRPNLVRVQKDGTINVLAGTNDYMGSPNKFWIVKPGATTSITSGKRSINDDYWVLSKDPYNDYMFIGGLENTFDGLGNNYQNAFLEKFLPDENGVYGKERQYLPPPGGYSPVVTSLFCGYNAVKYIVLHSQALFKLTPSGLFQILYQSNNFVSINDVIATKDSQTLYITEGGAIKAITKGKVRYLVGPHTNLKGKDGVGANADVYALNLALSKDESTLYFTDNSSRVRKLLLL